MDGEAFGSGPAADTQGRSTVRGHSGLGLARSFFADDQGQGTLTSPPFVIRYGKITFALAGGNHPGETCLDLVIDDEVVRTATGNNDQILRSMSWDVEEFVGKQATLVGRDQHSGSWGWICFDHIVNTDSP